MGVNLTGKHRWRRGWRAVPAAAVLACVLACVLALAGCLEETAQPTASVTVHAQFTGPSLRGLTTFVDTDVQSVTVEVFDGTTSVDSQALTYGSVTPGIWSGTFNLLPVGPLLRFDGTASKSGPNVDLFFGSQSLTLSPAGETIALSLAPVDDGEAYLFPRFVSIDNPTLEVSETVTVTVTVIGERSENLTIDFDTTDTVNSIFGTPSQAVTTDNKTPYDAVVTSTYTAPATDGTYPQTVWVTNSQGNVIEASFDMVVEPDDGLPPLVLPFTAITVPAVSVNQTINVTVSLESATKREDLTVEFDVTTDPANSDFGTPTQVVTTSNQSPYVVDAISTYTAPATPGDYLQTVTVTDESLVVTQAQFYITVSP